MFRLLRPIFQSSIPRQRLVAPHLPKKQISQTMPYTNSVFRQPQTRYYTNDVENVLTLNKQRIADKVFDLSSDLDSLKSSNNLITKFLKLAESWKNYSIKFNSDTCKNQQISSLKDILPELLNVDNCKNNKNINNKIIDLIHILNKCPVQEK